MQEIEEPNSISETEKHASKKRKMVEKVVVTVKIKENDRKQRKHEGPPDDCWSWRKYGQKPIKGSPYPRGYYRCSTSKGCSAKKQVERSKMDASMLIITYTCTHNHPAPDFSPILEQDQKEIDPTPTQPTLPQEQEQEHESEQPEAETVLTPEDSTPPAGNVEDSLPYSEYPFNSSTANHQEENPCDFQEKMEVQGLLPGGEDQKSSFSGGGQMEMLKQEENDFYDELEELPTSSFFTAFMRNSFCGERVIANPS